MDRHVDFRHCKEAPGRLFSIVLLRPEIPHNTGAIGRLCVGLGVPLHLVRPLGFALDDRRIARAGLDYWPHLDVALHDTWEGYLAAARPRRIFFLSTHGEKSLYECSFSRGDALVFGNESSGLPKDFYDRYKESLATKNRFSGFQCPANTREASTSPTPYPSPHTSATGR